MDVSNELIEKVAKNARLELTKEEKDEFIPQLKEIMESFAILDEAPVQNLHASFQPFPIKDIMRDDEIGECLTQEESLKNTVHKKDGFFKGPKTL